MDIVIYHNIWLSYICCLVFVLSMDIFVFLIIYGLYLLSHPKKEVRCTIVQHRLLLWLLQMILIKPKTLITDCDKIKKGSENDL